MTKVQRLQAKLDAIKQELEEAKRQSSIKCCACGRRTKINKLTFTQILNYEQPYGCNGGDYWYEGASVYTCPKCQYTHRLYIKKWNHSDPAVAEENAFAKYVISLRKYFGKLEYVKQR